MSNNFMSNNFINKIKNITPKYKYQFKECYNLGDCKTDLLNFGRAISDPECPLHAVKIKKLIECYNNHNKKQITSIDLQSSELLNVLTEQEQMDDIEMAYTWLDNEVENLMRTELFDRPDDIRDLLQPHPSRYSVGGKKRKTRKNTRNRKIRRIKKITKHHRKK